VMEKYGGVITLDHNLRRRGQTDSPMSRKLLGTMRVLVATEEELQAMLSGKRDPMRVVGAENEARAAQTLRAALTGVLSAVEGAVARCREQAGRVPEGWALGARMCECYLEGQLKILRDGLASLSSVF